MLQATLEIIGNILYNVSNISAFYYGKSTDISMPAAKAQCESMGMRLAVFHTQADWEAAKSFLNAYNSLYGYVKHKLYNHQFKELFIFNVFTVQLLFLYAHIKSLCFTRDTKWKKLSNLQKYCVSTETES